MRVRIWGARGSIPSPLKPESIRDKIVQAILGLGDEVDPHDPAAVRAYVDGLPPLEGGTAGGNTSCVEVRAGEEICIIDAGSGIRDLGLELMQGPCGRGQGVLHLFFSHAHWDHVQGFPFFRPAFVPGNKITIYSYHDHDWREVLASQQNSINFPISLDYLQADLEFIKLDPDQPLTLGPLQIKAIKTVHPGDAYAFRFEDEHSVFVYASDAEYKQFSETALRPYLDFFKEADVLIFDSQLSMREVRIEKEDWGHSSALIGVDLARRAGVKKLVLFHHDPTDSDVKLLQAQAEAIEYQAQQEASYSPCEVVVAYEGMTFELRPPSAISLGRLPQDETAILTLPPVFDERQVELFEEHLAMLSETGWPSRLIIDMSQVSTLAVMGLNPLISLRQMYPNTMIALVGLSERVERVIKLAGFLDYFAFYPTVEAALALPEVRAEPGRVIKQRYRIEDVVGEGWLGIVFKALDTSLKRRVALKVLSTSFSEHAINQFLHQSRQIIGLDHPNIVEVYECDQDQGLAYIAQELVTGRTLAEILIEAGDAAFPLDQAIEIGLDIARALEYAHGRGVIHGDLRPRNLFLADGQNGAGGLKLTDFGLGRLGEGQKLLDGPLILRTAHYLAPEQIMGEALDARTDLYALGVNLYRLVTGHLPFDGPDDDVMQAHLNTAPQLPRLHNAHISRSLEHFIIKLLAKDPNDRYATAHQARRVLGSLIIRGESQPASPARVRLSHHRPLIGREDIVQELLNCWAETQAGRGQLIFVAGETGIGKTRLTQEIAMRVRAGTLLVGHCQALEGSLAYQPFIEALQTYFVTAPPGLADQEVGRLLSNVARLVPEIHSILPGLPETPALDPKQEQLRLMNSLAQYIERATQEHPWLLILDDLHWADQSSLQLLHYLARHCASMSLLIIGAYRDTDLETSHPLLEMMQGLQRSPGYRTFTLSRLNQAEVGQMLVDMWGGAVPATLREKIYQGTEGNPFYVEEVTKGLMDEGLVTWQDGTWDFSTPEEIRLPQSVRDAVLRRIAYLDRPTQGLLRRAAVLGRTFNFDDLREMSDQSEWSILEDLDVALERQLIHEAPGETMLRFSHAEIQQVLYEELSLLRRRLLHRQAGEALERRYLSDPNRRMAEELAHHFDQAGEIEKALVYSIQAARHADRAYASQAALMWYGRALMLLDQLDLQESTLEQRFDLLLARERIYSRQGVRDKQAADLGAAQAVAEGLNNPTRLAMANNRQAYYYRLINDYERSIDYGDQALAAARQAEDAVLEGEALFNLAYTAEDQGQFDIAQQHLETGLAILEKTDDRRGEAIALVGLGKLHVDLNHYEKAQSYYYRALAMNRSLGNRRGEAICLDRLGELERKQGNYSAACSYYEQTLGIFRTIGDRQGEADALKHLGRAYLAMGSYESARSYIEQADPIYRSIDDQDGMADVLMVLSTIHYARAEYETARAEAEHALAIFDDMGGQADVADARLLVGHALEGLGDLTTAHKTYEKTLSEELAVGDEAGALDARAGLARCLLAQEDVDGALAQIELTITWLTNNGLSGIDQPFDLYLTAYRVLQSAARAETAQKVLAEAHTLLHDRAAQIADDDLRQSFLENVSQNKAIVREWGK